MPELDPRDVVVIDQSGALLSVGGDDPTLARSQQDMAITRAQEQALYEKVANILGPMVGADRFTAEVNATLDFTRSEQSSEFYNPDLVALRSEQRTEEEARKNAKQAKLKAREKQKGEAQKRKRKLKDEGKPA